MKNTGMVRKIDELGRIVIPKEIRKTLHMGVGEPLEIFIGESGEVVLKKYDIMVDFMGQLLDYVESLSAVTDMIAMVTNRKEVLAISGTGKKEFEDGILTTEAIKIIEKRSMWSTKDSSVIKIVANHDADKTYGEAICPIISDSDIIGSLILICNNPSKLIGNTELKLLQVASSFLAKRME